MIPAIASVDQADLVTHQFEFKRQLENVVAKIAIASHFTITYEDLEPLEVSPRIKEYLNQIAPTDRNRYLAIQLQRYLYSIFSRKLSSESLNSRLEDESSQNLPKKNSVNKWSKTKFYQELTQNNKSQGCLLYTSDAADEEL
jgi:hypothetical protein